MGQAPCCYEFHAVAEAVVTMVLIECPHVCDWAAAVVATPELSHRFPVGTWAPMLMLCNSALLLEMPRASRLLVPLFQAARPCLTPGPGRDRIQPISVALWIQQVGPIGCPDSVSGHSLSILASVASVSCSLGGKGVNCALFHSPEPLYTGGGVPGKHRKPGCRPA